jgi:hypothetical protein
MKALLVFLYLATPVAAHHDDTLRAGQFNDVTRFSPWLAMLPRVNDY